MEVKKGTNQALEDSKDFFKETEPTGQIMIFLGQGRGSSRVRMVVNGSFYMGDLEVQFFSETLKPDIKAKDSDEVLLWLMQMLPNILMKTDGASQLFSYGFTLCGPDGKRIDDDDPRVQIFQREVMPALQKSSLARQARDEKAH